MDFFGVGGAVKAAFRMYQQCSIHTGRSTYLLQVVQPGDRVIFASRVERRHFDNQLKEFGIERVTTAVVAIGRDMPCRLHDLKRSEGLTYFDHGWLEQYYQYCMDDWVKFVDEMQTNMSGRNLEHRKCQEMEERVYRLSMGVR